MYFYKQVMLYMLTFGTANINAFHSIATPALHPHQKSHIVFTNQPHRSCSNLTPSNDYSKTLTSSSQQQKQTRSSTSNSKHYMGVFFDEWSDATDSSSAHTPQFLTDYDKSVLAKMKSRHTTMPIMILDAMLPGQCLEFGSNDPKFLKLIDHVLDGNGEIGMIGLNPYTDKPLNMGVSFTITKDNVKINAFTGQVTIAIRGEKRFEVQGAPWLDESDSFYLADLEIVEDRAEIMSQEQKEEAKRLSSEIPSLVEQWLEQVFQSGKSDVDGMRERMNSIGPMPDTVGERAIWVGALINPIPPLGVCLEIRPAMLACKNDHQRMQLAIAAIQSSIDHLSGKRRLF